MRGSQDPQLPPPAGEKDDQYTDSLQYYPTGHGTLLSQVSNDLGNALLLPICLCFIFWQLAYASINASVCERQSLREIVLLLAHI